MRVGEAGLMGGFGGGWHQRPFLAEPEPHRRPQQADDAESCERMVPRVIDDQPVQRRHGENDAEGRPLRQHRGRQRALLVGKPFVDRVDGDRKRRAFAGAEDDAADHQRHETAGSDNGKLCQGPDQRQRQQHPARRDAIDDEADDDGRDREQEEERRAEQAELFGVELEVGHDRNGGEADDDLVGEVDHHEQEQQERDAPRSFRSRLCRHARLPRPSPASAGSIAAACDATR